MCEETFCQALFSSTTSELSSAFCYLCLSVSLFQLQSNLPFNGRRWLHLYWLQTWLRRSQVWKVHSFLLVLFQHLKSRTPSLRKTKHWHCLCGCWVSCLPVSAKRTHLAWIAHSIPLLVPTLTFPSPVSGSGRGPTQGKWSSCGQFDTAWFRGDSSILTEIAFCYRCELGYYGNPTNAGEKCEPCSCNPHGAVSDVCDPVTGRCTCREGITGRACNQCQPRYALVDGICTCEYFSSTPLAPCSAN